LLAGWVGRYVYVWLSAAADGTAGTTGGTGASGGTFVAYHLKTFSSECGKRALQKIKRKPKTRTGIHVLVMRPAKR